MLYLLEFILLLAYFIKSCPVGRVVSSRAYGSGYRGSIPKAGMTHIVFRKGLIIVRVVLEHDER